MNWTPEQSQAIYKKDSNILVAAAAGSGKTAVLVERIINKIIKEKIDIDKLLVVTFTNAAASEMRERILKSIYKIIDSEEPQDEETINHLQRQITLLNKASICTIDSFCLDVIKNNFFEIEISPNFRIADTAEIDLLKQEVLEKLFEEKYENHDKDFEKLIKTYTSYRDDTPLKDVILRIYTYIESNPFPLKWLKEQVEKFNIKDVKQDFSNTEWGKILLQNMKEELEDCIKKLQAEEKRLSFETELEQYERIILSDIQQLEMVYANLENWDKAYSLINNVDFLRWPTSKKITNSEKDKAKAIRDKITKDFRAKRAKIFTANSETANVDLIEMYEVLSKLEKLIIDFDVEFSKNKKDRNIVDFSDVEHLALKILVKEDETSSEIAKKYQEKFTEIAIDEYQDSNLVQEYILTSISNGKNIFMVGDVKQSIYKFRQAMPDLFLSKYSNYSENEANDKGLKIKLFKNFRSRKNVLDFTNIIFENIMGEKLGEIDYTEEEYLNLGASYEEGKEDLVSEIDILDTVEEVDEIQDDTEIEENTQSIDEEALEETEKVEDIELEAKFVAQKIRDLIDSKFQVYDNKKGEFRDIRFRDIVILLRSTKNKANIFEKELTNQNINVYSDTSQEYLESYEIQVIMDLLKIIDNPYQDIPLVHVMLSSIGMFTDDDLLEIRLCDQNDDFYTTLLKSRLSVREELREKIDIFLSKIEDFREKNGYIDLDELIWTIYEETGFLNYVALMPNGALRVANLKMLFERAKQYESASFKGLFNFINFIERIKLGSGDLGAAKLIGENEDVVRIMSIHKSKGLEFPVVFLSGTGKQFNMQDLNNKILLHPEIGIGVKYIDYDMQIEYDTLSKQAMRNQIMLETLSEEMRVLYVALTRAKEKLIITGYSTTDKQNGLHDICDKYSELNSILLKKCKTYLDWMELVYMYNQDEMKELSNINVYTKKEVLKMCKTEEVEKENTEKQILDKISKVKIDDEEKKKISKILEYKYKYQDSTTIPTKTSVTELKIAPKKSDLKCAKFLKEDAETKITNAQKGTLIHLCMQKLDTQNKNYTYSQIKDLVQDLENKKIITHKEAEAININKVYQFTKSKIWEEMIHAHAVHREKAFYISIPAKEVFDKELEEKILVQGVIDLYYINEQNELILVDFKTDYVEDRNEQILVDKYNIQLELYKRALEDALQRKVDKVYIYSTYLEKEILL